MRAVVCAERPQPLSEECRRLSAEVRTSCSLIPSRLPVISSTEQYSVSRKNFT